MGQTMYATFTAVLLVLLSTIWCDVFPIKNCHTALDMTAPSRIDESEWALYNFYCEHRNYHPCDFECMDNWSRIVFNNGLWQSIVFIFKCFNSWILHGAQKISVSSFLCYTANCKILAVTFLVWTCDLRCNGKWSRKLHLSLKYM